MDISLARNALALEAVNGNDHFLLVYFNTLADRVAAKEAVRTWLLDCELDFNRWGAEQFWKAIDAHRFSGRFDFRVDGGVQRNQRRRT